MKKYKIALNISLSLMVDTDGNVEVLECRPQLSDKEELTVNQWMKIQLSPVEVKYGYIKVSSRSSIGKILPLGTSVNIHILDVNSNLIQDIVVRSHKSVRGRIDGLTGTFSALNFCGNSELALRYMPDRKILEVRIL